MICLNTARCCAEQQQLCSHSIAQGLGSLASQGKLWMLWLCKHHELNASPCQAGKWDFWAPVVTVLGVLSEQPSLHWLTNWCYCVRGHTRVSELIWGEHTAAGICFSSCFLKLHQDHWWAKQGSKWILKVGQKTSRFPCSLWFRWTKAAADSAVF